MTQDFAKPSTTRKPGQAKKKNGHVDKPAPRGSKKPARKNTYNIPEATTKAPNRKGLFITFLIFLLGAFAYGLYLLQRVPETNSIEKESKPLPKEIKNASQAPKIQDENRFNFYKLLPEHEVIAPKVEAYKFKEKAHEGEVYYVIQTGSFRNKEDAERQKAMIAFKGIKASIDSFTNDSGTTWHRVTTDPYYDRSKMNSALDKLVSMQIEPLVKKVKKQD